MQRPIRVGHVNLSFHDASARQIEGVLLRHGHVTERIAASEELLFRRMAQGDVDLLVSAWLPVSHGKYVASLDKHVRKLAVLYKPYVSDQPPHLDWRVTGR